MKNIIKSILKYFGYQIFPFPDPDQKRRIKIVTYYDINLLLDIGANDGQYVRDMRKLGYKKQIISFEPMSLPFKILQIAANKDENWNVYNYGLGDNNMVANINIAGNSGSSSILNMLPVHLQNSPESKFIGIEQVEIKSLDSIINEFDIEVKNVMLKIDVQGYEMEVLKGAFKTLKFIKLLQLEMSLLPLYQDETKLIDMLNYLNEIGFNLISIENGFSNQNSGELLQVDGIFVNRKFKK